MTLPTYSGNLSLSSPKFVRPNGGGGIYYYEAIQMTVSISGIYNFTSSSSMDTFGCLYNNPIDLSYPLQNLITTDDDGNGGQQFRITYNLRAGYTYVLIVTTFDTAVRGIFSVTATGPTRLNLVSIRPITSRPITSGLPSPSRK
ncbi:unnamed protein product [Rotaria sp. Silwood2]|nr:unnamed protein product [Rotaria sp. Silwood2]